MIAARQGWLAAAATSLLSVALAQTIIVDGEVIGMSRSTFLFRPRLPPNRDKTSGTYVGVGNAWNVFLELVCL